MQNGARGEQKLITANIFPSWLIALFFLLLSHFFSRFTTARARVFVQAGVCARRLFLPGCLPQGARARGDPDREIVGIRGVTRGDLVLVHNGSICLRSSCRTPRTSSNAPDIAGAALFQTRRIRIWGDISGKFSSSRLQSINERVYYKYAINSP